MRTGAILLLALLAILIDHAAAQSELPGRFGVRAGLGTDVTGGIAYGVGANFALPRGDGLAIELGIQLFGGTFEEESNNGFNDYFEETEVFVFALTGNFLVGPALEGRGPFFIGGIGIGSVSMWWEESSPTDTSLGPPLPGGGSMQEADGSGGGTIFNLGGGYALGNGAEIRLEFPVLVAFSPPGEATSVAPAFTAGVGYRF